MLDRITYRADSQLRHRQVGQRVSAFFMGGSGGGQVQQSYDGGAGWGPGYGGQQQQMQMGYGGQPMGGYPAQYGQQMPQAGYMQGGGMYYGMGQQQQMGGGFQVTQDMPRRPQQQRQNSDLKKPSMRPGVRRNQGFHCSGPLWLALFGILFTLFASALTAGLVVSANTASFNKFQAPDDLSNSSSVFETATPTLAPTVAAG